MGRETGIEWTDATWNPIRGCSMVSAGCTHCYAQTVAHRFSGPGQPYEGLVQLGADGKSTGKWNGAIRFVEESLLDPLKWKTPRRIFVNSMSDLLHEGVTEEMIAQVLAVCILAPQHDYQVLTKRPERALRLLSSKEFEELVTQSAETLCAALGYDEFIPHWPLPNRWLGTSIEGDRVRERSSILRKTPAAVRFLSIEPLIEPLEFLNLDGIDWVIVGGESGSGARPMHPDWVRSLRDQCKAARVPFFFKRWGEWAPGAQQADYSRVKNAAFTRIDTAGVTCLDARRWAATDALFYRVGKKAAGHLLDGVAHREFPAVAPCPR